MTDDGLSDAETRRIRELIKRHKATLEMLADIKYNREWLRAAREASWEEDDLSKEFKEMYASGEADFFIGFHVEDAPFLAEMFSKMGNEGQAEFFSKNLPEFKDLAWDRHRVEEYEKVKECSKG